MAMFINQLDNYLKIKTLPQHMLGPFSVWFPEEQETQPSFGGQTAQPTQLKQAPLFRGPHSGRDSAQAE